MIQDILDTNRYRLSNTSTPKYRVEVINEMKAELTAMKETYEAIHGKVDMEVFADAMRLS
jgi:hypothetical protein